MQKLISALIFTLLFSVHLLAQEVPTGKPAASIDLASVDGAKLVSGEWKYSDTRIVETDFRSAGADNQPSGPSVKTYDYTPHAGGTDFDDSAWEKIAATDLGKRRGNGKLSFNWYRVTITVPKRLVISIRQVRPSCFRRLSTITPRSG